MRGLRLAVAVLWLLGCRRQPPPPRAAPTGGPTCPAPADVARLVAEPGREVRSDCVLYAPRFLWLAAALGYARGGGSPRLSLIYGGQPPSVYEVDAAPPEALTRIIAGSPDLRVSIRKPSPSSRLVRVGVFGQRGSDRAPEADEVVVVLRLVAHAPPEVLWVGPGDQVRTDRSGCVSERTVDFEMPFGDRLEMTTVQRAHPATGKQLCPAGPSSQQTIEFKPRPLARSHPAAGG